jgi:hypothetical protein
MQKPFNADFYVTAATVIPVFYLALTLQGSTYRDLMTRWRKNQMENPGAAATALDYTGRDLRARRADRDLECRS